MTGHGGALDSRGAELSSSNGESDEPSVSWLLYSGRSSKDEQAGTYSAKLLAGT